jgi:hypothetical protein
VRDCSIPSAPELKSGTEEESCGCAMRRLREVAEFLVVLHGMKIADRSMMDSEDAEGFVRHAMEGSL